MHRGDVRRRFGLPTRANRCLDEVHEHVEGNGNVRREKAWWADPARLPECLLEITPSERGQRRAPGRLATELPGFPVGRPTG